MAIIVICTNAKCGKRLTLGDDRAGTTLNCPACGLPIKVPPPPSPSPSPSGADSHPDLIPSADDWLLPPEPPGRSTPGAPKLVFPCPRCSKVYNARVEDFGKAMKCKKCGVVVTIPGGPPTPPDYPSPPLSSVFEPEEESPSQTTPSWWRDPVKLALSVACFCGCSLLLFVVFLAMILARESPPVGLVVVAAILFFVSLVSGILTIQLFVAKQQAIAAKGRPVPLFFGLARLITWEQNDGVILLRDKKIAETIYGPKSGGGLRIIYPVLGEEDRVRVPLTLQLTWFRDERVLTRESIQLVVKVAIWWEVSDLEAYFYRIDQEVHALRDRDRGRPGDGVATMGNRGPRGRLAIAEVWVETIAEACLRKLISDTSTFLIISKRAASHLHVESSHAPRVGGFADIEDLKPATPDVIAEQLKNELTPRVQSYGLKIDRVEIQEVQLPQAIQQAVDDVWIASTLPTKSAHEARALENRLEVLCRLLGKESVGLSEIMSRLPPGAYMSNPLMWLPAILEQIAGASKAASPGPPALPAPATPVGLPVAPPPPRPSRP